MSLKLDYPVAQSAIVKHMKGMQIPVKIVGIAIVHTINKHFTENESVKNRPETKLYKWIIAIITQRWSNVWLFPTAY